MTTDPLFTAWLATREHHGLPWQTDVAELRAAWDAGRAAGADGGWTVTPMPGTCDQWADQINLERAGLISYDAHLTVVDDNPMDPLSTARPSSPASARSCPITAETIYAAYPRRVAKAAALKAIGKALKAMGGRTIKESMVNAMRGRFNACETITPARLLLALTQAYAAAVARWPVADKKFIPHPSTWYNRGSYEDDPQEWQRGAGAAGSQFGRSY